MKPVLVTVTSKEKSLSKITFGFKGNFIIYPKISIIKLTKVLSWFFKSPSYVDKLLPPYLINSFSYNNF
jgi:hypothetical protein